MQASNHRLLILIDSSHGAFYILFRVKYLTRFRNIVWVLMIALSFSKWLCKLSCFCKREREKEGCIDFKCSIIRLYLSQYIWIYKRAGLRKIIVQGYGLAKVWNRREKNNSKRRTTYTIHLTDRITPISNPTTQQLLVLHIGGQGGLDDDSRHTVGIDVGRRPEQIIHD